MPKPFSRIILSHGRPISVSPELDEAGLERLSATIEVTLRALQATLDAEVDGVVAVGAVDDDAGGAGGGSGA